MSTPIGECFVFLLLFLPGEGDAAGVEHWLLPGIPGAVLVIAYKRIPSAGELYPDLVTAAGMEPDTHQAGFAGFQNMIFQSCRLDSGPLPIYHKDLVFLGVLP